MSIPRGHNRSVVVCKAKICDKLCIFSPDFIVLENYGYDPSGDRMDVFETVSQKCSVSEGNVNSRSTVLVSSPIDSYKNHLLALLRAQSRIMAYRVGTTRIYHECEGWIEKFVLRIALTTKGLPSDENSDPEGQIFLSHSHTNNRFFFLLIIRFTVLF